MSTTIELTEYAPSVPRDKDNSLASSINLPSNAASNSNILGPTNETIGSAAAPIEQNALETGVTEPMALSRARTISVITTLTGIMFASSMSTGLLAIGLPVIAKKLELADNLLLWPASVYSLASGCCLLPAGAIADLLGNRSINLIGTFLIGVFALASGLSSSGIQLVLFRAFQGVGAALCFPTAFSIMTDAFPNGRRRNLGFACLGLGQPFGYAVGLILGGVFEDIPALGWRFGFYLCAGATLILRGVNAKELPMDRARTPFSWKKLRVEIDWVGVALSSSSLGILSYVFAMITGSLSSIRSPVNIVLLSIASAMIPAFIYWMHRQESLDKPALIPNSLWKNSAFTAICVMVLLSWAVLNGMEWFLSLFFQQVQLLSPMQSSIRFLPNVIIGIILNLCTGLLVHRVSVNKLVLITTFLSAGSPLLMAVIDPQWSWWWCAFWAVALGPLSVDVIFTIANLIITDAFPTHTQALAGAVFNTVAQFGTSIGLAVMAIISSSVTNESGYKAKTSPEALMLGYRAVFWACFALMMAAVAVGLVGLRRVGKVGVKRE